MSDPTPTSFLPGKNERRSHNKTFRSYADIHSLEQIFEDARTRGPITQAHSREHFISVLDRQYEISQERGYPLCLALATLDPRSQDASLAPLAVLNTVAKICRSNLRPTDLVFRYADGLVAMVLLECDELGGESVAVRLKRSLDRRLYFGKTALSVRPVFAVSDMSIGFGSAGKSLLSSAELVLSRADFAAGDVAIASVVLAPPHVDVQLRARDIANAITGMYDTSA